jgi:hypothetical protein
LCYNDSYGTPSDATSITADTCDGKGIEKYTCGTAVGCTDVYREDVITGAVLGASTACSYGDAEGYESHMFSVDSNAVVGFLGGDRSMICTDGSCNVCSSSYTNTDATLWCKANMPNYILSYGCFEHEPSYCNSSSNAIFCRRVYTYKKREITCCK